MRRLIAIVVVLSAAAGGLLLTGASNDSSGKTYKIQFDNSFGLTEGGDFKVGGVKAGQTTKFYVDSQPGTSPEKIPDNGTVPATQTESNVPTDLLNNVLRRPYRERLRLIIAELGTGLADRKS